MLQQQLGVQPLVCQLLVQRGIYSFETAKQFFRPSLADLHDPFLMADMAVAVDRLEAAVENGEKILLYGDYDVDGTTSVAMMYSFLNRFPCSLDYYIPDRNLEGYGISKEGVDYADQMGCTLVIAMDCGIKSQEAVLYAQTLGIDFIICDHHLPEGDLPLAVANLDPKRPDCPYPCKELSGCGIAFKLAQAFCIKKAIPFDDIIPLLDLLAISIACDIVPMTGENRILTWFGLKQLNQSPRLGLLALIAWSRRRPPLSISDVVFGLGPIINAAGRLANAKETVQMLLSTDKNAAYLQMQQLSEKNTQRRAVDREMAREAHLMFQSKPDWQHRKSIVLYNPEWHKGIIGIVASRLVDTFHRPTIVLMKSGDRAVGSARSVPGFDLYEALKKCDHLLYSFGGHAFAAGMQLPIENVPEFEAFFEKISAECMTQEMEQKTLEINCELPLEDITPEFWRILKQFAPMGPSNMNPVFWTKNLEIVGEPKILENNHVQFKVKQKMGTREFRAIGFGIADHFMEVIKGEFNLAYTLREESPHFDRGKNGYGYIQLQVKSIVASPAE